MKSPVLMVAYLYPPDNFSGAIRAGRFVKYLKRLGHPVTVLAAAAENLGEVAEGIHRVRGEFGFAPRRDFSAYLERGIHKLLLPSDWGYTWAWRAAAYAGRFMRSNPRPVVVSTFPPLVGHWVGLWLKKRYGAGWVADFRDPLWGDPVRMTRRSASFDRWMERVIFRNADRVIANTDVMQEGWRHTYPQWERKTHLIWNGYDPDEGLGPRLLPPRPYKVIAHVGSIYSRRHPSLLLASIGRLTGRGLLDPGSLKVRLVGHLEHSEVLSRETLDNMVAPGLVEIVPELPRAASQLEMATSDYLLLLDMLLDEPSVYVPAKVYEYLQVGRPILLVTTRNSVTERVLARSGVPYGCLFADDSQAEIDRRLLEFLSLDTKPVAVSQEFSSVFSALPQAIHLSSLIEAAAGKSAPSATTMTSATL